jgi:hypothetical protein
LVVVAAVAPPAVTATSMAAAVVVQVVSKTALLICHRLRVQLFLMLLVQAAQAAHKQQVQEILAQTVETQLLALLYRLGIYQQQAAEQVKAEMDKATLAVVAAATAVHHHLARQAAVVVVLAATAIAQGQKSQLTQ